MLFGMGTGGAKSSSWPGGGFRTTARLGTAACLALVERYGEAPIWLLRKNTALR
jgi:hypothetical protein